MRRTVTRPVSHPGDERGSAWSAVDREMAHFRCISVRSDESDWPLDIAALGRRCSRVLPEQ